MLHANIQIITSAYLLFILITSY